MLRCCCYIVREMNILQRIKKTLTTAKPFAYHLLTRFNACLLRRFAKKWDSELDFNVPRAISIPVQGLA